MSTRVNDPKTAAKVVVMQRCHQQDLGGHLLEQGGWEHLCLPAEYEGPGRVTSIGWSSPRKNWANCRPERFGPAEPETLKRSRKLRGCGPASAAAFAGGRWHLQASLVSLLAAAGSQTSARYGPSPGRHPAIDHC